MGPFVAVGAVGLTWPGLAGVRVCRGRNLTGGSAITLVFDYQADRC